MKTFEVSLVVIVDDVETPEDAALTFFEQYLRAPHEILPIVRIIECDADGEPIPWTSRQVDLQDLSAERTRPTG